MHMLLMYWSNQTFAYDITQSLALGYTLFSKCGIVLLAAFSEPRGWFRRVGLVTGLWVGQAYKVF